MSLISSVERLYRKMLAVVSIGRITIVDDTGPVQTAQVNFGPNQIVDGVPLPQHFGFSSNPPPGSDVVGVCLVGDRSKATGITSNKQDKRFKGLAPGEAVVYDAFGNYVVLRQAGITIHANGVPVTIEGASAINGTATGDITFQGANINLKGNVKNTDGNITSTGDITDNIGTNSDTMGGFRTKYNTHKHPVTGIQHGTDSVDSGTTSDPA